jgi:hypothetical protein
MDIDACKSYATVENLKKALVKAGIDTHRYLVVCNTKGRYTAVFPFANVADDRYGIQGNLCIYPHNGFMIFG